MYIADGWKDFEVIDTSAGEKLERWGDYFLVRPDPQIIWNSKKKEKEWNKKNAHYHRSERGGGSWEFFDLPDTWQIGYELGKNSPYDEYTLTFNLKPFKFKHTGVFPEQAVNWEWMYERIKRSEKIKGLGEGGLKYEDPSDSFKVLNMFAYTGGATMACAAAGAALTHVDAAKGMVAWAKENAASSGLGGASVRYLVDDCVKFVEREIRRGHKYDGIVMDPPSYGRGPKGEIWKIEDQVYEFIELCLEILADDASFFLINSYTTGLQAGVLKTMLDMTITERFGGNTEADEVGLPIRGKKGQKTSAILPCGACGRWYRGD